MEEQAESLALLVCTYIGLLDCLLYVKKHILCECAVLIEILKATKYHQAASYTLTHTGRVLIGIEWH